MLQVIFCTSHIASDPDRYLGWACYYSALFDNSIDLVMVNDGPAPPDIDLKRVHLIQFPDHLGRRTVTQMPGWKRSFGHALQYCQGRYDRIAHIESDCWLRPNGKEEFLRWMNSDGYYTPFARLYGFPESAIQIFNDSEKFSYLVERYRSPSSWDEEVHFEREVVLPLSPKYILDGDRIQGVANMERPHYTYLAQVEPYFRNFAKSCRDGKPPDPYYAKWI